MNGIGQFALSKKTVKYIEEIGFAEFTTIQARTIPLILKGRDVIGLADTGTGKTHAYLIPILDRIKVRQKRVQAVVIAPTRELCRQIYDAAKRYESVEPELNVRLVTSELSREKIIQELKEQPQLVIGTPGRLKDLFLDEGALRLDTAETLVVDEADMTMEFGFIADIDAIAGHLRKDLQMLAFSATMPEALKAFLDKYMHAPATIAVKNDTDFFANVHHYLVPARHHTYTETLLRILPGFNPYLCLIFANSRSAAKETAEAMRAAGYKLTEIHGDLTVRQRKSAMKEIAEGRTPYIVATDIAARGIDIPGISHVVSLGFPKATEYYIHRAGRTGRIKSEGICYAIYRPEDDAVIRELRNRGISFGHEDFRGGEWHALKPYGYRRKRPITEMEKEIRRVVSRKPKKVMPGYKKKQAAAIDKIKRDHKRAIIQESIRQQAKEKNRLKERAKRHYDD